MLIFYLILFIVFLSAVRFTTGFNKEYLSFDTTNQIKGFFISLVFISHVVYYIDLSDAELTKWGGPFFLSVHNCIGQWIVAMFLFYSGYGIMESIKKKGDIYIADIPKRRALNTLLNFDVAVIGFILIALLLGTELSIWQIVLSFFAWDAVGNDNWYIFVIISSYLIAYFSFKNTNSWNRSFFLCLFLSLLLIVVLGFFKPEFWYNTLLCFCAGIFFSKFREIVESFVCRHYWVMLTAILLLMILLCNLPIFARGLVYNAFSVTFCAFVLLMTLKFKLNSPILLWCGKNLFPLYIYQRIPMIILFNINGGTFVNNYPIIYALLCMIITGLIAYLYKYWNVKL